MSELPHGFRQADSAKRCANCQYFMLEYCQLYDLPVAQDDMCNMWMPVFKYYAKKYEDIDFTPPQYAIEAYRNGLQRHENGETGDGIEPITIRMANHFAQGKPATPEWVRKGNRWWSRNGRFADFEPGTPAYAAAQLWGGDNWFASIVEQMDTADKKEG